MLLFEFFPAFVALVSVVVGVALWRANTRARSGPNPEPPRSAGGAAERRQGRCRVRGAGRPSFRA